MATASVRKPRRKVAPTVATPAEARSDRALIAAEQYWEETRRPFPCLLFLAPLLIAYEIGVLWLSRGHESLLRNGADTWMRSWLYAAGVHQSFVLPIVVLALLLIWNFYGYFNWRVRAETLAGMLAESLIYAFVLVILAQGSEMMVRRAGFPTAAIVASPDLAAGNNPRSPGKPELSGMRIYGINSSAHCPLPLAEIDAHSNEALSAEDSGAAVGAGTQGEEVRSLQQPAASTSAQTAARTLTFIGAGIYEEVLFRLLLLPACYLWFRALRASQRASMSLAILTTSLMFALAHYVGPAGDALVPYTFGFRVAAGIYFAGLFVSRGFGITVGAHAFYDLIVGLFWAA